VWGWGRGKEEGVCGAECHVIAGRQDRCSWLHATQVFCTALPAAQLVSELRPSHQANQGQGQ
jgi:hypothetical protein